MPVIVEVMGSNLYSTLFYLHQNFVIKNFFQSFFFKVLYLGLELRLGLSYIYNLKTAVQIAKQQWDSKSKHTITNLWRELYVECTLAVNVLTRDTSRYLNHLQAVPSSAITKAGRPD